MRVINARNPHEALSFALRLLDQEGIERGSRNGPVLTVPYPVTTVYTKPCERVVFWPERDCNPAFHLYESLWMLAGRNDVAGPARYAKNIENYSDDGETLHGAYGHRWRHYGDASSQWGTEDQLPEVVKMLQANPDDRRCVISMWDSARDLGRIGKDVPCNTMATLQRGVDGELNLVVFCRSNDVIWGCYGANAVHFSFLLEYIALAIGCPVGTYTQVSVNWHAYLNTFEQVKSIRPDPLNFVDNPYTDMRVHFTPLSGSIERVDELIYTLLECADEDHLLEGDGPHDPWARVAWYMLGAHQIWRTHLKGDRRYIDALEHLSRAPDQSNDWIVAGREWLQRRYDKWKQRFVHPGDFKDFKGSDWQQ